MEKVLKFDLKEKRSISPYLYMQFMEPLCSPGGVEALPGPICLRQQKLFGI